MQLLYSELTELQIHQAFLFSFFTSNTFLYHCIVVQINHIIQLQAQLL